MINLPLIVCHTCGSLGAEGRTGSSVGWPAFFAASTSSVVCKFEIVSERASVGLAWEQRQRKRASDTHVLIELDSKVEAELVKLGLGWRRNRSKGAESDGECLRVRPEKRKVTDCRSFRVACKALPCLPRSWASCRDY